MFIFTSEDGVAELHSVNHENHRPYVWTEALSAMVSYCVSQHKSYLV